MNPDSGRDVTSTGYFVLPNSDGLISPERCALALTAPPGRRLEWVYRGRRMSLPGPTYAPLPIPLPTPAPAKTNYYKQVTGILYAVPAGSLLEERLTPFVIQALSRHPEWGRRTERGVVALRVCRTVITARAFFPVIEDATTSPECIGAETAIKGPRPALSEFFRAARVAIEVQTWAFGVQHGAVVGQDHVDHLAPLTFDQLLFAWCSLNALDPVRVRLDWSEFRYDIADPHLRRSWQDFHAKHAELRVITRAENLRLPKSPRPPWDTLRQSH